MALPDLLQGLQRRTVPFDRCPETTSSSATEPRSGGSSTPSTSRDGEHASGATYWRSWTATARDAAGAARARTSARSGRWTTRLDRELGRVARARGVLLSRRRPPTPRRPSIRCGWLDLTLPPP